MAGIQRAVVELRRRMSVLRLREQRENSTNPRDYRTVSVYPSTSELVSPNREKLPVNIIKGPYTDIYEYLNTHFSLLREDFIKPIREDIISFLSNTNEKLHSITIHKVHVVFKSVKNGDICFCFEIKKGVTYSSLNLTGDKRFMMGSLLIFSKDNFKTSFCGRIADNKSITHKKVLVSFEESVSLKFKQEYLMIECNNFFEPYFYVMKALQTVSSKTLSLQRYLIEAKSSIDMPKYLDGMKYSVSDAELNKSQLVAINAALSQELVIIQGPPGTGKTFLGLKIAKLLLSTSKNWYNESPMLIISFTNHALDQFLEGLTDSTDRIFRYGGQSKNPKMKDFSMRNCRNRYYKTPRGNQLRARMAPLYSEYRKVETQIRHIEIQMDNIITSKPTCIFNFNILAKGVPDIKMFFSNKEVQYIVSWLLEEDGTIIGETGPPTTVSNVYSKQGCHPSKDSEKIAALYEKFVKNFHKPSNYCMISVSIIENAARELLNRIVEINQGIEKKKEKFESTANQDVLEQHLQYLKVQQEKVDSLNVTYTYLIRKGQYLKICLNTDFNNDFDRNNVELRNPCDVPVKVRWQLYKYWLKCYDTYLKEKMDSLIHEYMPIYDLFSKEQENNNLAVMRYQKIIGMTTTSAARLHSTIRTLKCPIVIVEEAAEVLEAHIIPVLTEHCQHLILIGDHQQLKPATADYDIEIRNKLGVSLFERMVINDIQCHTLNVQHRMRPEISSLITPSIYPVLHDHQSVKNFPQIHGVDKCLYFITHNEPEQGSGDSSKKNIHEAEFLIQLAVYLLKNGHSPEDITILAAYMGQVRALTQQQEENDGEIKKVKITSVDNFQGEENKIILLSLVRNNSERKIGFLSIENRVCVALSRAKEGMYIMGNIEQLSTCSKLWQKIKLSLKEQNALGTFLPLKCQQHREVTEVKNADDFKIKNPNGGCNKICDISLSCGHKCQWYCHGDDLLHEKYKCTEQCLRSACKNASHKCQKKCYQVCGQCMHQLTTKLSCRHYMKCYMEEMEDYKCEEIVNLRFSCGHKLNVSCYEIVTDSKTDLKCSVCCTSGKAEAILENDDDDIDELVNGVNKIGLVEIPSDENRSDLNKIGKSSIDPRQKIFDSGILQVMKSVKKSSLLKKGL